MLPHMALFKQQTSEPVPPQAGEFGKEHKDNTDFIPNFIQASNMPSKKGEKKKHTNHSKPQWKKGDSFKEMDFSNSLGPFLSTCWKNLLPWEFSTETLVCVSSRDTDFTNYSLASIY